MARTNAISSVSYTHLDVYKRQSVDLCPAQMKLRFEVTDGNGGQKK